jgi:archaellum component FlaC
MGIRLSSDDKGLDKIEPYKTFTYKISPDDNPINKGDMREIASLLKDMLCELESLKTEVKELKKTESLYKARNTLRK